MGEEIAEFLAGGAFGDEAEEEEAGVGVEVAAVGGEVQGGLAGDAGQELGVGGGHGQVGAADAHDFQHVADAGAVVHQVVDGDGGGVIQEFGEMEADVVVEREFALLGEEEDGGAGKLFRYRGDTEGGVGADGGGEFDAGEAGALVED